MIGDATNCFQEGGDNCDRIYREIIKKGIKEKVDYLDWLYYKASVYFIRSNQIDSAEYYADKGIENRKDYENNFYADLLNIKATVLVNRGDLDTAIGTFIKSAKELEKRGDSLRWAYSLTNIGLTLYSIKDYDKSLDYLLKSHQLQIKLKDSALLGTGAGNIGLLYFTIGDRKNSEIWARRALKIGKDNNDGMATLLGSNTMANLKMDSDLDSAYYYSRQAVDLSQTGPNRRQLGNSMFLHAKVLSAQGKLNEALTAINEAVEIQNAIGSLEEKVETLYLAAEINSKLGNYKQATEYYSEYRKLNDSLFKENTNRAISELNIKFETEKKEKQIAEQELKIQKQRSNLWISILGGALAVFVLGGVYLYTRRMHRMKLNQLQQEKENAILNSFIQGEERERNRISTELHDGVAAMIGAAKMSLDAIPHLSEEKQKEQFEKIKGILENTHADVRHIAHNLMPSVLEKEGIIKASEHFASEINQTKLVSISVEDKDSRAEELPKNLQLMLFRVIQELVSNIIKHSQAQNATISFSRSAAGLNIEVTDDGVGYEGDLNSGNQGLYSISQRLKSIGGNFKFIKRHDRGMSAIAEVKI